MKDLEKTVVQAVKERIQDYPSLGIATFSKLEQNNPNIYDHLNVTATLGKTAVEFTGFEKGHSDDSIKYEAAGKIAKDLIIESAGRFLRLIALQLSTQDIPFPKDYELTRAFDENPLSDKDTGFEIDLDSHPSESEFHVAEYEAMSKMTQKELSDLMKRKPETSKEINALLDFSLNAFVEKVGDSLQLDEEIVNEMAIKLYFGSQIGIIGMYSIFQQYANSSRLYRMEDFEQETISAMVTKHHSEGFFGWDISDMMQKNYESIHGQVWSYRKLVQVAMREVGKSVEVQKRVEGQKKIGNSTIIPVVDLEGYKRIEEFADSSFEEAAGRLFFLVEEDLKAKGKKIPKDEDNPLLHFYIDKGIQPNADFYERVAGDSDDIYRVRDENNKVVFTTQFNPYVFTKTIFDETLNYLTLFQGTHPVTSNAILNIASVCTDVFKEHLETEHNWLEEKEKSLFEDRFYVSSIIGLTELYKSMKDFARYAVDMEK